MSHNNAKPWIVHIVKKASAPGVRLTIFHSILSLAGSTFYAEYSVIGITLMVVHSSRHDNVNVLKSTLILLP